MRIDKAKVRMPNSEKEVAQSEKKQRVSVYSESYKGEYYNIDTDKLVPFKKQARKNFDNKSLEELAATIKIHGIRQPLTVIGSKDHEGKYEVVSGERRWRAAQLVGLNKVPCIILHNDNSAEEVALIENIQRKNLHPLELMHGLQSLLDNGTCKTHQEIADKIGVSRTYIVEILGLSRLPSSTQSYLLNNAIKSRDILRKLLKQPEEKHINIIKQSNEFNQIVTTEEKNKSAVGQRKKKLISIHIDSEKIIFNEANKIELNKEQKEQLKDYLVQLAARI